MRNSIRGLDKWGREAREWSRYEGRLRMRAGAGLIGALESYYEQWQKKPTDRLRRDYMTMETASYTSNGMAILSSSKN